MSRMAVITPAKEYTSNLASRHTKVGRGSLANEQREPFSVAILGLAAYVRRTGTQRCTGRDRREAVQVLRELVKRLLGDAQADRSRGSDPRQRDFEHGLW